MCRRYLRQGVNLTPVPSSSDLSVTNVYPPPSEIGNHFQRLVRRASHEKTNNLSARMHPPACNRTACKCKTKTSTDATVPETIAITASVELCFQFARNWVSKQEQLLHSASCSLEYSTKVNISHQLFLIVPHCP